MKFKNIFFVTMSLVLIFGYNSCTERALDMGHLGSTAGFTISSVSVNGSQISVSGQNLEKITSLGIKGGEKTLPLAINTKNTNVILAQTSVVLELIAGLYHLVINTANAEVLQPIQVTIGTSASVKWTPYVLTLGSLPLVGGTTVDYSLPAAVPVSAKEVLVFAYYVSGYNSQQSAIYNVFTREGSLEYMFRMFIQTHPQDAISFGNQNHWLPITSDRKVWVKKDNSSTAEVPANSSGFVQLLGYR